MGQYLVNNSKVKTYLIGLAVFGMVLAGLGFAIQEHGAEHWWGGLLQNATFFLGIAGFAAFFVAIHTLGHSGWHVAIQRIPEAMATYLPVGALLLLLVIPGIGTIYHWSHPGDDELLLHKAAWLNQPFFIVRMLLFLTVWALVYWQFRKRSLIMDQSNDIEQFIKLKTISAIFAVTFIFTFYLSAWDWLMSIDPHWYSTIYSFLIIASAFTASISAIIVLTYLVTKIGGFAHVTSQNFRDLGTYLFAFSLFWGYLFGAQYLLIWYSDIPEEVVYYAVRFEHFPFLFGAVAVLNIVVPFIGLLTRGSRYSRVWLTSIAALVLVGQWLHYFLLIFPGMSHEPLTVGVTEIGIALIFAAIFGFVFLNSLAKGKEIPEGHPFVKEAIHS